MDLGANIAELRKAQELTQRELAEKLSVSQSHLARWETNKLQPRKKALEELAEALNVTVDEIVSGGSRNLENAINVQDKELLQLLRELQYLSEKEVEALKTVMRGLLSRSRIQHSLQL